MARHIFCLFENVRVASLFQEHTFPWWQQKQKYEEEVEVEEKVAF